MPTPKNPTSSDFKSGFALIVTLSLMILLTVIAVGLLSLSAISLRSSGAGAAQTTAQANARLALMLAIGELQKNLGPDKRTSATASLLKDGSKNPHWAGAWNTEGGFRGWLVSGNEAVIQPTQPQDDISAPPFKADDFDPTSAAPNTSVRLVGKNTLGAAAPPTDYVFAPMVNLTQNSKVSGRYAWWIGDEGVKANLASPVQPLPNASAGVSERLQYLASAPNRGFPTLDGAWKKWLTAAEGGSLPPADVLSAKLLSRNQVALANPALIATQEDKARFHDFTASSAGVLSDSKNGGLRKDLSIAFEIPEASFKNSEFTRLLTAGDMPNAYVTDHGSKVVAGSPFKGRLTKPIFNYTDPAFSGSFYRGPTFDILRDHYQFYRRFSNPFSASASIDSQIGSPNIPDMWTAPSRERSDRAVYDTSSAGTTPRIRQLTTELVPELTHYAYTFALQSYKVAGDTVGKSRIRLIVNPFIALYNPYNVVLKSPPLFMRVERAEVGIELALPGIGNKLFNMLDPFVDSDSYLGPAGYQTIDHYISDSGDPHPPAGGAPGITLQPGEIKLYTITGGQPVNVDIKFSSPSSALCFQALNPSDPQQLFSSGLYSELRWKSDDKNLPPDADNLPDPLLVDDGTTFTVKANNKGWLGASSQNSENYPSLGNTFNEYFEIEIRQVKSFSGDPRNNTPDNFRAIRELRILNGSYWQGPPLNNTPLKISPPQISGNPSDPNGGQRYYVAQSDMFWKTAVGVTGTDNNFSLTTHNPRAPEQSTTGSGGQGPNATRGPATWTGYAQRLDGSQPNFDVRFWGTGKDIQDGGTQFLTLWDIPRAPITSIASFQHANVGRLFAGSAYPIGNSYASPFVPQDVLQNVSGGYWNFDDSYLCNEALFDSYFFSGVNPGKTNSSWSNPITDSSVRLKPDPTSMTPLQATLDAWIAGTGKLANPRIAFVPPSGSENRPVAETLNLAQGYQSAQTKLSATADIRPHNAIAAYALNMGAFNVNSVSINAWRAILAGLRAAPVDHFSSPGSGSLSVDSDTKSAFPGSSLPGAKSVIGNDVNLWNGFRRLSDPEITTLATKIVAGIKARAQVSKRPFTTMGEFVNRRIGSGSTLAGILQTAIDQSGLNASSNLSSISIPAADKNFKTKKNTPQETVTTEYANSAALAASTIAGTPQWLTQADVLESVGPQLSARSDTFTIRAYGESVNPATGRTARAWLEATVQRGTAFVDSAENAALPPSSLTSTANLIFGRRFKIIAFRWVSPEEI